MTRKISFFILDIFSIVFVMIFFYGYSKQGSPSVEIIFFHAVIVKFLFTQIDVLKDCNSSSLKKICFLFL